MTLSRLIRFLGLVAILAAILFLSKPLCTLVLCPGVPTSVTVPCLIAGLVDLFSKILLLLALLGVYLAQAKSIGSFGLFSFVLSIIGTALVVGVKWVRVFVQPVILERVPALLQEAVVPSPFRQALFLSFLVFVVGLVLLSIATIKARRLPRWAAVLIILAVVADYTLPMGYNYSEPLLGFALIGLGYACWKRGDEMAMSSDSAPAVGS